MVLETVPLLAVLIPGERRNSLSGFHLGGFAQRRSRTSTCKWMVFCAECDAENLSLAVAAQPLIFVSGLVVARPSGPLYPIQAVALSWPHTLSSQTR